EAKAKEPAADRETVDAELAALGKKLDPLDKEAGSVTRRAADLRDAMRRVDEKIAFAEASLGAAEEEKRAGLEAEIASLKADRKSLREDEPALAGSLDSLHPQKAKLEAARADARKRRQEPEQDGRADQGRTDARLAPLAAQ